MNWKFLIIAVIFYLAVSLITKIADKRKVKKYGRDINIYNTSRNDNTTSGDNDGTADVGTDKQ